MWDIINELDLPNDEIAYLLIEIMLESKNKIDADCRKTEKRSAMHRLPILLRRLSDGAGYSASDRRL